VDKARRHSPTSPAAAGDPGTELVRVTSGTLSTALARAESRRQEYARASRSEGTRAAYATDWARFVAWAEELGLPTLPTSPRVVGQHLAWLADEGCACSTIDRAVAAIGYHHRDAGFEWYPGHPEIARTRGGIRRRLGTAQTKKAPLTGDLLARAAPLLEGPDAVMYLALLTVGFFGGLRRSEIVAIEPAHVRFAAVRGVEWVVVHLPKRKTDQEGRGGDVPMQAQPDAAVCPVRSMRAWLAVRPEGPRVFPCSGRTVARLVQRLARKLDLDPGTFGGHSLRAGMITTAAGDHVPLDVIMRQSGHASVKVAMGYIRSATIFDDNVTSAFARKHVEEEDRT
jgi:integrase